MKKIIYSILPSILFFLSISYLMFSGLNAAKAIKVQNKVFLVFVRALAEKDVLLAISESLSYILTEAILPSLPFLFLLGSGFLAIFIFKNEINYLSLTLMQIPFLMLASLLAGFSLTVFLTYIGILSSIILLKTFEPRKTAFLTGSYLVSRHLRLVFIFLAIGLFLSLYLNFESYKQEVLSGTFDIIKLVIPDIGKLQQEQAKIFANQCAEGMKKSINQSYQTVPSPTKETCEPVYSSVIAGIDDYKQEAIKQIENKTVSEERVREYVIENFPILEQTTKATPLILAVLLYSFLEVLKLFAALVFGLAYSAIKKK
ncbi:MAG: hypothetical protein QMD12_01530 [Candidatus Aenigmarchaeota archaeon]|nr:hypothetical protein [Candidatus Aenigmarchaeota archaeon]